VTKIEQVYEALAQAVRTIPGLRCKDYVPGDTEFPASFLEPPAIETDNLGDDTLTLTFDLVVLVSTFEHRRQKQLYKYQDPTGPHSIVQAIKADRSLGFDDVHVHAAAWRPLAMVEMSYYRAFGAALTLTVYVGDC